MIFGVYDVFCPKLKSQRKRQSPFQERLDEYHIQVTPSKPNTFTLTQSFKRETVATSACIDREALSKISDEPEERRQA